jgi:hypothetical protein
MATVKVAPTNHVGTTFTVALQIYITIFSNAHIGQIKLENGL